MPSASVYKNKFIFYTHLYYNIKLVLGQAFMKLKWD